MQEDKTALHADCMSKQFVDNVASVAILATCWHFVPTDWCNPRSVTENLWFLSGIEPGGLGHQRIGTISVRH